jgi:hypothetical protein
MSARQGVCCTYSGSRSGRAVLLLQCLQHHVCVSGVHAEVCEHKTLYVLCEREREKKKEDQRQAGKEGEEEGGKARESAV